MMLGPVYIWAIYHLIFANIKITYCLSMGKKVNHLNLLAKLLLLICLPMTFTGCKEEIDESNFAIKSEPTAADFIESNPNFSMVKTLFSNVTLGNSDGASSILSVLSARGNYTIFLPTNKAVQNFLNEHGVASIEEIPQELASLVAKSCIIDHNDDNAYETADFPTTGSFNLPNLNDRLLTCQMDSTSHYIINGTSKVVGEDNEVSNGFVHVVDVVVAPSAKTLDKLIAEASNMKVFSYLLQKTTWADSLHANLDLSYEDPDRPVNFVLNNVDPFTNAQHRYIGYTAIVEPDSIYEDALKIKVQTDAEGNITNGDAFVNKIAEIAQQYYGNEKMDDLTNGDNPVNRFVAYHLLYGKMAFNKLVFHYNEYGYKFGDPKHPQQTNMPTNVWEYYTTMGKHPGLVKITQVGDAGFEQDTEHKMYVNRISEYANGPEDDYRELGVVGNHKGYQIEPTNGNFDNNGLNGYYYPIEKLLLYTNSFRNELSKVRIRMDVNSMLPELVSNNFRGDIYVRFENGYFDNITNESPDTKLLYLKQQGANGWGDYQGDEFMVSGLYDFTMKLPPVPTDGTYEIRMGVSHNPLRGMCQIYFGDDPDRLTPAGLPYDMRASAGPDNPNIPWFTDGDDWVVNYENDKNLRNQGYMKAPMYFTNCTGKADFPCRLRSTTVRRIITVANMKADETYYLRFKSALKKTDSQFFMDYFEFASTSVYNGPKSEDIW